MRFPRGCEFLGTIGQLPRMVAEGLPLIGTIETPGAGNNPVIMGWARELGLERVYTADSVPWCALFVALCAHRAGKALPASPLWALNWSNFGEPAGQPCLGDVCAFVRPGGGHVGIYIAEDQAAYHVLEGNASDRVMIGRVDKHRLHAARKPIFAIAAPASRRPYVVAPGGGLISTNEA